jgi:hypothetical protein
MAVTLIELLILPFPFFQPGIFLFKTFVRHFLGNRRVPFILCLAGGLLFTLECLPCFPFSWDVRGRYGTFARFF